MGWDVKKMADYEEINAKLDRLLQLNDEKIDNTLLRTQKGKLIGKIDFLTFRLEKMSIALLQILDIASLGREDQNHLPTIVKIAKRGLGEK